MVLMHPIVGTPTDNARGPVQWQAARMNAVVLIVLILALLGIVASALMVVGVALSRNKRG
jgi:hypothetical protein